MFNNLIESSSHAGEFKRRGSFFLFTTVSYLLLFAIAGVMSIYAYDATLDEPNTELVTMLNPIDFIEAPRPAPNPQAAGARRDSNRQTVAERAVAMTSVRRPDVVPDKVSATPNKNLPIPDRIPFAVTGRDLDPSSTGGPVQPNASGTSNAGNGGTQVIDVGAPPPVQVVKKAPQVMSKGVVNGEAVFLPKPSYPPLAKEMRIQGTVSVQVLIDETGKVISARAVSGSAALVSAAQKAALEARFSPTRLSDQPVKVSGVITYNFMLQ